MRLPWQNESLDWLVGIGAKDLADEKRISGYTFRQKLAFTKHY